MQSWYHQPAIKSSSPAAVWDSFKGRHTATGVANSVPAPRHSRLPPHSSWRQSPKPNAVPPSSNWLKLEATDTGLVQNSKRVPLAFFASFCFWTARPPIMPHSDLPGKKRRWARS
ncbi:hypothetical protein V2G26_008199 [Clonostachys chloroleuca]